MRLSRYSSPEGKERHMSLCENEYSQVFRELHAQAAQTTEKDSEVANK